MACSERDFFTVRDILRFAWQQLRFVALGENLEHVAEIQKRALSFVSGHSVAEMKAIGEEVYDELMADKIWPGTQALARRHLAAGDQVWLVTATPVEVAEVIAERLGLTGALGTVAEHVDGIYTGRLVGRPMHGKAKAEAVIDLSERIGIDLERSAAYSDSANDIPLLSLVGQPVAVNPDARAARPRPRPGLAGPRLPHPPPAGGQGRRPRGGAGGRPGRRRLRRHRRQPPPPLIASGQGSPHAGSKRKRQKNTERRCMSRA